MEIKLDCYDLNVNVLPVYKHTARSAPIEASIPTWLEGPLRSGNRVN